MTENFALETAGQKQRQPTPERNSKMDTSSEHKNDITAESAPTHVRTVERKIGKATFIVTSRFNDGKEKDIVSTIARLVQHDNSGKSA